MTLICGTWNRGRGPGFSLQEMLRPLPGPSDAVTGHWTDGSLAVAWRSRAASPEEGAPLFVHARPDHGLVAVGAIRLDARNELCGRLRTSPSRPDIELVLCAYRRWGRDCPEFLIGDFAFVVWDSRRRVLFCARDHIGARPFYYNLTPQRLVFASSIASVLAAPGVPDDLDDEELGRWFPLEASSSGEKTLRRAVRRLPAGHALELSGNRVRLWRWWRPEDECRAAPATVDEYADAFLSLYREVVSDALRGAARVGVHLSGGLDSSSITALSACELRRRGRPPPVAFSWHPPPPARQPRTEAEVAEYRLVESVAAASGVRLGFCPPTWEDVLAALRADATLGGHIGTSAHEPVVLRRASELGVDVLLSGWGGDEGISFNARGYDAWLFRTGRWRRLWREVAERSDRRFVHIALHVAPPAILRPSLYGLSALLGRRLGGQRPLRAPPFLRRMHRRRGTPDRPGRWWPGVRDTQLWLLLRGHIAERVEGWSETGARFGVEHRYPLLDRRLLRFALGLPPEQFRRGAWSRWLMRHGLRGVLPQEVCWRRSKADPLRYEAANSANSAAFAAVRRELEARAVEPSRAPYFDMRRLMAHLNQSGARPELHWSLLKALSFLDF